MPIHPDQRHRYPADWDAISLRTREAAGHRCQWCGVPNGALGARRRNGAWMPTRPVDDDGAMPAPGRVHWCQSPEGSVLARIIRIVLTVAHLDHQPENNDPENLRALCQRCHLNHDRRHHRAVRLGRRRAAMRTGELLGGRAA